MVLIILNFKIFWMKLIIWILIILSFVNTLMTSFVLSISFVQRIPVAFFFQGYRELSIFLHIVIDSTGICLTVEFFITLNKFIFLDLRVWNSKNLGIAPKKIE